MNEFNRLEHEQIGVWLKDCGYVGVDKGIEDFQHGPQLLYKGLDGLIDRNDTVNDRHDARGI
jgi:hypothetical protein